MAEPDDGPDKLLIVRVCQYFLHERAIKLHPVDVEFTQIRQARVSDTKIIKADANPEIA